MLTANKNLLLRTIAAVFVSVQVAAGAIDFNRDVRPILSNHCFTCHGPDAKSRESGLRLDQRAAAIRPADSGLPAIVPGDADSSQLIIRVLAEDPDERMPPAHSKSQLSKAQISTLAEWINQGAEYQTHWAFAPITQPQVPTTEHSQWPRNAIDHFVLDKLEKHGLQPAAEAARETLIRRVAFDLTGLPPTIAEIDTYLQDTSVGAYERMMDRYLTSPAYGEHMARHWLDLARYADTNGYQYDTERTQWVWRDWVIDAYNRNLGFDDFTIQQLAGDLLPNSTPQQRLATGFNRNHGITIEGGIIDEEYRTEYVMDRLVTTGNVWLGMTIGCARCHDHKYDPISQQEFYQLYAFFNQVPERGMKGFAPQEKIPSPLGDRRQQQLDAELAELQQQLKTPIDVSAELQRWANSQSVSTDAGWSILQPVSAVSSGGSTLTRLDDGSLLAGDANPQQDIYEITAHTHAVNLTAIRLETLTHDSLPGGGPGRHSNSNFVLSEFEVTVRSLADPSQSQRLTFSKAIADYSQANYEIAKAIDGTTASNNGWAVDGPTRKQNATALFVAAAPFGYEGGTELQFRLRHEASFATHGIGRPRLSVTVDPVESLQFHGVPEEIRQIAARSASERSSDEAALLRDYFLTHHHPHKELQQRIATIQQQQAEAYPLTMIMQDTQEWRATHVLNRGQYNEPQEEVQPGVPTVFPNLPEGESANRLGLARWLVSANHPLTARVAVNRYWQRLFGTGLVEDIRRLRLSGRITQSPRAAWTGWRSGIHSQ
jgi:mono/diheme cytochrome c family protein